MLVAVSPYHLTTREPAAAAALLLADRVVTLLPAPFSGRRDVAEEAAQQIPKYLDFMLSWQWSIPLWEAGLICARVNGDAGPAPDVRAAFDQIAGDDRYSLLRALMRPEMFDAEDVYLEAVARDLLKGGPDPGITVPVAAGMDAFAIRHSAAVARSHPSSVVQKAEEQLGRRLFAFVIPILLQCSADRLLEARRLLEPQLKSLRAAVHAQTNGAAGPAARADLSQAAAAFTRAFESIRDELTAPGEDDEARIIDGAVAITGVLLPADAVLSSSLAALRSLSPTAAPAQHPAEPKPHANDLTNAHVLTLMVRVLGRH